MTMSLLDALEYGELDMKAVRGSRGRGGKTNRKEEGKLRSGRKEEKTKKHHASRKKWRHNENLRSKQRGGPRGLMVQKTCSIIDLLTCLQFRALLVPTLRSGHQHL